LMHFMPAPVYVEGLYVAHSFFSFFSTPILKK
jgi:hypothetical protein